jgi:hypothetical protein
MQSAHDSKVAGHFGRERTMELLSRNFYWPNMEKDVRKDCNECDNCKRMKAQRHAKHSLCKGRYACARLRRHTYRN